MMTSPSLDIWEAIAVVYTFRTFVDAFLWPVLSGIQSPEVSWSFEHRCNEYEGMVVMALVKL
jgi:hypothetical protein